MNITKIGYIVLLLLAVFSHTKSAATAGSDNPPDKLPELVKRIEKTMQTNIYDAAILDTPEYRKIMTEVKELAQQNIDESVFMQQFNELWKFGPFSHVNLIKSQQTPDAMAKYFDSMDAGAQATTLEIKQNIAILTVNTMMGQDTIQLIESAYKDIKQKGINSLIIDLRQNQGGAFAVVPLVGHLLDHKIVAGVFLSNQSQNSDNKTLTTARSSSLPTWKGRSLESFWRDIAQQPMTKIMFEPLGEKYTGNVYVLTSHVTASAAEMASDVLKQLENVTLVGEKTAGKMLSQKPYSVGRGYYLFLPFADYVSQATGRIEGQGVTPDVNIKAASALDFTIDKILTEQPVRGSNKLPLR